MYKNILVCLDNSNHSNAASALAIEIARARGALLTGCHVYAAKLHNTRFIEMEDGLPQEYRQEEILRNTREVHDTLITKGLKIISDSYMSVFQAMAAGLEVKGVDREGKNFEEIVKEVSECPYDLVAMGLLGLGRTGTSSIGSVAERVVRRVRTDVLLTQEGADTGKGIMVAIDGSPASFGALLRAIELSGIFDCDIEAVSAFDPVFHQSAFRSIAGVLTEEAGKLFRFKEQEKLHDEIIDKGLAKLYMGHLETAEKVAASRGKRIKTTLLAGKASEEVIRHARKTAPFMLAAGRTGAHAVAGLDIGSNIENCLRNVRCHVLVSSTEFTPEIGHKDGSLAWTEEAKALLSRIPKFARGVVKRVIEDTAKKEGLLEVTPDLMRRVRKKLEG